MVANLGFFSVNKILIAVIIVWLLVLILVSSPLFRRDDDAYSPVNDNSDLILARINRATNELNLLKNQNKELKLVLEKLRFSNKLDGDVLNDLIKHENQIQSQSDLYYHNQYLSNLIKDLNELKFYTEQQLKLNVDDKKNLKEQFLNLEYELDELSQRDYDWKREQMNKLKDRVQNAIHRLQNPVNCETAKKLICQLNKGCGFGCQLHHVVYCLNAALATNRTMILETKMWRYAPKVQLAKLNLGIKSGWNLVFEPLSESCLSSEGANRLPFKRMDENTQIIDMPIVDTIMEKPKYFPLSLPSQISEKLVQLHKSPYVWFYGQLAAYIMRPSEEMDKFLSKNERKFDFKGPIVGVQVRRTDKIGIEASYHKLSEYMDQVEKYYERMDFFNARRGNTEKIIRRVYLATDEEEIWSEAKKTFEPKGFVFVGDPKIADSAQLTKRYSIQSLKNVIMDIYFLSKSDFIVCTFSSQVCRLAYELMQANNPDMKLYTKKVDFSQEFYSLDDIYYFGGQRPHNMIAIYDHKTNLDGHINLKAGDVIGIAGNHWNGFSLGLNRRTERSGLFPTYKAKEAIETYQFKAFD